MPSAPGRDARRPRRRVFAAFLRRSGGDAESAVRRSRIMTMALSILSLARRAIFVGAIVAAAPAIADQSCGDDLQKLSQRREAALQAINGMVAAARGKQLDAAV